MDGFELLWMTLGLGNAQPPNLILGNYRKSLRYTWKKNSCRIR